MSQGAAVGVNTESKDWPGGLVVTGRRMALWRRQLLPGRPEPVWGPRGLVGDYVGEKFRVDVSFHEDLSFLGWPLARVGSGCRSAGLEPVYIEVMGLMERLPSLAPRGLLKLAPSRTAPG